MEKMQFAFDKRGKFSRKLLLKMKLTFFIVVVSLMQVSATVYSQATKFSFDFQGKQVVDVLKEIEDKSDFRFFYQREQIDVTRVVNLKVNQESVESILAELFKDRGISYKVLEDNLIILVPEKSKIPMNQQKSVSGKVTSKSGATMPGVSVVVKGTTFGTITDANGNYALTDIPENTSLSFSFVGMKSQNIMVQGKSSINVVMEEDNLALDEVIVIGYGTAKRKDFTGSVSSLRMEDSPAALMPNLNALEPLKGNVAGLNIGAVNSAGGEPTMQIRGQNSIKGSNNPLIVVDGVIFLGSLSDINPNDIASYDVLKDAVSAAVYGSRSSNGVIAITTKKGQTSKPTITFNTSTAIQHWQDRPNLMKADQWIELNNAQVKRAADDISWLKPQEKANRDAGIETDWLDVVSHTGVVQNYQVAVSGAANGVNYYLSTSYDDNKGIIVNDHFNRISVLGKINTNITRWLQIGADASFSKRDYSGNVPDLKVAEMMSPYGVVYRDSLNNVEKYPVEGGANYINPLWGINDGTVEDRDIRQNYRLNSYAIITAPWIKGLTFRLNFQNNLDRREVGSFAHEGNYVLEGPVTDANRYNPAVIQNYLAKANGAMSDYNTYSYVWDNILNYNQNFNKHNIDLTLVSTRDYSKYGYKNITGSDFAANGNSSLGYWGLHKATVQKINLDAWEKSNIGYLGRLSYGYNDKYLFTGSYRRDGASVFGANKKWGNFAAAGLGWRISNEKFLKDFTPLNSLKLKLSWGQNGNQGVGPYSTLGKVNNGSSAAIRYEFSNAPSKILYGLAQANMANSNLGWESTEKWNSGFESAWLNSRIFLDLDLYYSKTTDEIYTPTIPSINGFSTITSSLGEVHNRGIEVALKTVNLESKNLYWSTSVTFWMNRNKLVHIDGIDMDGDGKEDDRSTDGMFIGYPLGSLYGYVQDGIVQTEDVEYKAMPGASTIDGYPKYKDISGPDGVPDGSITPDDRTILGYPQENFRLNLSNTVSFKNFELYFMISGIFGGNNYFLRSNTMAYTSLFNGYPNTIYRPYWTTENPTNVYPAAYFPGDGKFLGLQSRQFIRVQNVSLSYSLGRKCLEKTKLKSLKIFCTATNPFISSDWVGGDPEIGTTLLSNSMPVASTYSLGMNISF